MQSLQSAIILPLLLGAFVLSAWQYYTADPENRVSDRRFLVAAAALAAALSYLVVKAFDPEMSFGPVFLGAAALLMGFSLLMLRRSSAARDAATERRRGG